MRKVSSWLLGILLFISMPLSADWSEAESFYDQALATSDEKKQAEHLNQALALLLEHEESSAAWAYNIGNCFLLLGEEARAIAFYEQARVLDPRNDQLLHNLNVALKQLELAPVYHGWLESVTSRELHWFALVIVVGALFCRWFRWNDQLALSTALGALLVCTLHSYLLPEYAVLLENTPLRLGKGEVYAQVNSLKRGERVYFLEGSEEWLRIRGSQGKEGFVPATAVQRVSR